MLEGRRTALCRFLPPAEPWEAYKRYRANVPKFSAVSFQYTDGPKPPVKPAADIALLRVGLLG